MTKRTEANITYSRTVQLKQYEPMTVGLSTKLEDPNGLADDVIESEHKSLVDFVDSLISHLINKC